MASTAAGQQAALASPNEAYVLALSPSGQLTIKERATGRVRLDSGTARHCLPPYKLVLQPNGMLLLTNNHGTVLWASGAACAGNTTCYSYALQNDGQLVVRDGSGQQVWSSSTADAAAARGQLGQIVSGGVVSASCIHSGPSPAASLLLSTSGLYKLVLQQQGAALQLLDNSSSAQLWSPAGALPGQAPARLCISGQGSLELAGSRGTLLWSSGPAGPANAAPYVALVAEDGCLKVLDGSCSMRWFNHDSVRGHKAPPPRRSINAGNKRLPPRSPAALPPLQGVTLISGQPRRPAPGRARAQPPGDSASRRTQPPGTARGARPPPVRSTSSLAPPAGSSQARPPPKPAAQLVQVPLRKPPSAKPAPKAAAILAPTARPASAAAVGGSSPASTRACSMQRDQLCGGLTMCGADTACMHIGCCAAQLTCTRHSEFVWLCGR